MPTIFDAIDNKGLVEIKNVFYTEGKDIWEQSNHNGLNPLHYACAKGNYDVVLFMLTREGVDVNAEGIEDGVTPLQIACRAGNEGITMLLMEYGAAQDKEDYFGVDPIVSLCQGDHVSILQILNQELPLIFVIQQRYSKEIIEFAMSEVDIRAHDFWKKHGDARLSYFDLSTLVPELVGLGVNVLTPTHHGYSFLHFVADQPEIATKGLSGAILDVTEDCCL